MTRRIALLCASLLGLTAPAMTASAENSGPIRFTLGSQRGDSNKIHADFRLNGKGRHQNNWSTGFMPSELVGLEVSSFRASGSRPLHFSLIREAGRLDCGGSGGAGQAAGSCRFSENAAFTQLLVSRGIARPDPDQAFALMAVNARRDMIDALTAAHYPTPSIDNLTALAALGVDRAYIDSMARVGYRPATLHSLVEFKALGVNADWIAGFVRIGYANLPADDLVQLRALNVTPDYIADFQRLGYKDLAVDRLVELKALNITPEFVKKIAAERGSVPPVQKLVEYKLFGARRER